MNDVGMSDNDALGHASRAGSEEDVRGVVDGVLVIERLARITLEVFARKSSSEVVPFDPALPHPADRRYIPARLIRHHFIEQRRHCPAGDDETRGAGVYDLLQSGGRAGSV